MAIVWFVLCLWHSSTCMQTAGVLVWQLNDCWPVISWAIADFFVSAKIKLLPPYLPLTPRCHFDSSVRNLCTTPLRGN